MRTKFDWRKSVYREMGVFLVISFLAAGVFFLLMSFGASFVLEKYEQNMQPTGVQIQKMEGFRNELVGEIEKGTLQLDDPDSFLFWSQKHMDVDFSIKTEEQEPIYCSETGSSEIVPLQGSAWEQRYTFQYAGKEYELHVYQYWEGDEMSANLVLILVLILSFFVFFAVFLSGVRRKTRYLDQLSQEVEILEAGNLDLEVTIHGRDEIAELARGLESMRKSFRQQVEEIDKLSEENYTIVTQMSHDLRSPLTAISLYADILENNDNLTDEQKKEYLGKITKKVQHMKELSEHLLKYSEEQREEAVILEKAEIGQFFYEELSDFCSYLLEQGFLLETSLNWEEGKVYVNREAVSRVLNNISSNLLKYADRMLPVYITSSSDEDFFILEFKNSIDHGERLVTGNGIGLFSVDEMMKNIQGDTDISGDEDVFSLMLKFRKVK